MNSFLEKALEIYGETMDPSLAGYILPDGSMLNMSYTGHRRNRDHRDLGDVWEEMGKDCPDEYGGCMIAFEHWGAIRFYQYGQGTNISLNTYYWPNWRQWEAIRLVGNEREIAFDVYNDNNNRVHSEVIDFAWGNWISVLQDALEDAKENR